MRRIITAIAIILVFLCGQIHAALVGTIYDSRTNEGIKHASIYVHDMDKTFYADKNGNFTIDVEPGIYRIDFSATGYKTYTVFEVLVKSASNTELSIYLDTEKNSLDSVVVQAQQFYKTREVPISVLGVSSFEVMHMPGATMDISKYVKNLPGVAPKVAFGYNLTIRGSAPFENSYYLDGIKIPSITHFDVMGTSGGPNGSINPELISSLNFYRGHLPVEYSGGTSGAIEMKAKVGNTEQWTGNFTLGASDIGFLAEGPTSQNSSLIIAARESFSQHLLKAIGLPVVPAYYDAQLKWHWRNESGWEVSILGIGTYDKYRLNFDAEKTTELLYNLGALPEGNQLSASYGTHIKYYSENGLTEFVLSQSLLNNKAWKYRKNNTEDIRLLDFNSTINDVDIRLDHTFYINKKDLLRIGVNFNRLKFPFRYKKYLYSTAQDRILYIDKDDVLKSMGYGAYISYSSWIIDKAWDYNLSFRLDGNNFSSASANVLSQFSPRLSTTYHINSAWNISAMVGRYSQMPPPILLSANLNNRDNISYLHNIQTSLGVRYLSSIGYQVNLELYHKYYTDYPLLMESLISYANATSDYVAVGNQAAISEGEGRTMGFSLMVKKELTDHLAWQINYTLALSEFSNTLESDLLKPSIWDNTHSFNIMANYVLKKGWNFSARWFYSTGSPYSPYNYSVSSLKRNWDFLYHGIHDYTQINELRLKDFHALAFRIDKQFNFKSWSLSCYLDIQNVYSATLNAIPYLTAIRTENGFKTDPQDPSRYEMNELPSDTGRTLPTVGVIIDI